MDDMMGSEIILMDGKIRKLMDNKDLESCLGDGKVKFSKSAKVVLNSVKLNQALKEAKMENLIGSEKEFIGTKIYDEDISNESFNSFKKPSDKSSLTNEDDIIKSQNELNKNEQLNGIAEDPSRNMEAAITDVIISEYPGYCFPDDWYEKHCPCCLAETRFWITWKQIRLKSYQLVEHKYFETLVIILILLSSMCLVCLK